MCDAELGPDGWSWTNRERENAEGTHRRLAISVDSIDQSRLRPGIHWRLGLARRSFDEWEGEGRLACRSL